MSPELDVERRERQYYHESDGQLRDVADEAELRIRRAFRRRGAGYEMAEAAADEGAAEHGNQWPPAGVEGRGMHARPNSCDVDYREHQSHVV